MRIVFDTNVYVAAFVVPGSKAELALTLAARGLFELIVSPPILAELESKLRAKFGYPADEVTAVVRAARDLATLVEPAATLTILADEPDNRILECAVAAEAAAIITGDKHLLALKQHDGIGIMTVAELLYTFPGPEHG